MATENFAEPILSFRELIDRFSPDSVNPDEILSFCHTTREGYATDIITKNYAKAMPCKVYLEDLVYFFYGKANYVIDKDEMASYTDDPPVCFIFNPNAVKEQMKRILPFDSGGYPRYEVKTGYTKDRYTYELPQLKHILGYIKLIYKTHERYMRGDVDMENLLLFKDVCIELEEMIKMYEKAAKGDLKAGKQLYTFEVQYGSNVAFEPSHIVIPYLYYTKPYWSKHFNARFPNILLEHYGEVEQFENYGQPLENFEYHSLMRKKVSEILNKTV
ncbi:hypothetical protein LX99_02865 [Mucilaginibacter oryzae]|uniref:Uncharacterized protein n=1 Tax=Mucilaginibacter oryzae TaxID=468058 RepID=A0A316HFP6_9SPHI|nr:hypothetical protein [Mucilaginibacter oryzae]PWK77055.1 hypothetical protein LX99_02865 [Mucilaginibacter oryzae]